MKVEVRIPTYKRTVLLRRALESLRAQTHVDWIARVFDDSPSREAQQICQILADGRIMYEPNPTNLGICKNIDRSFSIVPLPGSEFLCVLEDDNYYMPDCLRANVAALNARGHDVLLRNQRIELMKIRDEPGELTERTTYDHQYQEGAIDHADLFASFFFSTGANNSSIFWRANVGLDFSTVDYLDDVVSQERLRTLCIDRNILIGMDPLIIWRDNGDESLRPKLKSRTEWRVGQIRYAADERAIYAGLYTFLRNSGYDESIFTALDSRAVECERVLWRVGVPVPARHRRLPSGVVARLSMKRRLARLACLLLGYGPRISIDPNRRRLTAAPARADSD